MIPSNLGGGLHGHLGLVIPTSEYNNISGCHFIKPVFPEKLQIPNNSAPHDAIRMHEEHNKTIKHFHEIIAVENVLKSQIIGAIDSVYIKERINKSTETILHDTPKFSLFYLTDMVKSNMTI